MAYDWKEEWAKDLKYVEKIIQKKLKNTKNISIKKLLIKSLIN